MMITPDQYLEIEREAAYKSEYCDGIMRQMPITNSAHSLIAGDVTYLLIMQLRSRNCFVYGSDMRLGGSQTGLYTYPDVTVVCGERKFLDDRRDTLLNPSVIVEVLSPSTEAYDRGRKFDHYRALESLRAYLLIASDHMHVDLFTPTPAGQWLLTPAARPEDTV
jgi:Uma2 family endonuclease